MLGQIAAFLAVIASVAFADSCGQCYTGYGSYVSSPVISVLPSGGATSVLRTGCDTEVIPSRVPALPFVASEGCQTPVITARTFSAPVIATETPVAAATNCSTPVIATKVCETPVVATKVCETPVVATKVCETPVVAPKVCKTPVISTTICGIPVSASSKMYATPLYRETIGRPEIYASCENSVRSPVVCNPVVLTGVCGL